MKTLRLTIVIGLVFLGSTFKINAQCNDWYKKGIKTAEEQLKLAAKHYEPGQNPRSIEPNGTMRIAPARDWTCGFFPGNLWYMYELSGNKQFKKDAIRFTEALDEVQYYTHTHDLGFMLNCSYGNAYRLTNEEAYAKVLHQGAKSLSTRFSPKVGCIKSWNFGPWSYPVIIDNMMNLELLFWASNNSDNQKFKEIAITHANTTIKNQFREDYSTCHVVNYDSITGKRIAQETHQGLANESAWARGQGWGLYGYTLMYRATKDKKYLEQAINIAEFIINHPSMPEDKIPLWDFDTPNPKHAPRDASAAAIIASALLELGEYAKDGKKYQDFAEKVLINLSSPRYLASVGENAFFILKHSTGHLPNYSEIDVPLNYADYYYLEAMLRYKKLKNN